MDPVISAHNKTSQETQRSLLIFLEPDRKPNRKPKVIYTANSLEFGKACEDLSWNHCISTPHRSETNGIAERAVRRFKGRYVFSIVAIRSEWKLVGRFHGMQHLSGKGSRFLIWWEDATWETFWDNLKDQLFHLVHWLSITVSLRKTSQESINLERKCYLDCSSDTLCTRAEFGRVTYWLQTFRSWKRWTHQKSTRKDSMQKRWYFPKKMENILPVTDGRIKLPGGDQDLRTSTLIRDRPIWGETHVDFLGESEGSLPLLSGCRWSDECFLVHVRKLHIPPSRWTKSQTLLAERRIIPYSTEIHWRLQNYSYEFGCQARKTHRWLLEYRWVKRFAWLLDRFHSVYSIRRKTSRRIFVVQEETDKKAANIQARSFMSRTLDENWEEMPSWRRGKSGHMKNLNSIMQENYEEFISLTLRTWNAKRPSRMLARNWKRQWLPFCLARVTRGESNEIKSKFACILEASESTRLRMGESFPNHHEDHIAGKGTNHCSITICIPNLFLSPKPWKFLQLRQRWTRNGKNWRKDSGVEPDESQK